MITIYYAGDIHGSEVCFKKFLNAASVYKVDILILGGDLTAKMIIPVVIRGNDVFEATLFGQVRRADGKDALKDLEAQINTNGFYSYRCEPEELAELLSSPQKQSELFHRVIFRSLEGWLELAEKRLADMKVECYIMAGNDDDPGIIDLLNTNRIVVNPEGRKVNLSGGYEMISLGYSNRTPFDSHRELDEDSLYEKIAESAADLRDPRKAIFNLHCPPYDSGLDIAPELTQDLKPIMKGGGCLMKPVGSLAVRRAIDQFAPLISLHCHVHECPGAVRLGRTLAINPGSEYSVGILRGVIVRLRDDRVINYQFVSG